MGRKFLIAFSAISVLLGLLIVQHASAATYITNNFLDPTTNDKDVTLGLWQADGVTLLLSAPKSDFRVFEPVGRANSSTNSDVVVTLKGICTSGKPIEATWDGHTVDTSACGKVTSADTDNHSVHCGITSVPANDIRFCINTVGPDTTTAQQQPGRYGGPGGPYDTDAFAVQYNGAAAPATQYFTVQVSPDSYVTYDDQGSTIATTPPHNSGATHDSGKIICSNPSKYDTLADAQKTSIVNAAQGFCGYPGDTAFSVIPTDSSGTTFKLNFTPNCDYTGGPVYLEWFDADQKDPDEDGGYPTYGGNMSWTLVDKTTGVTIASLTAPDKLGGEGSYAFDNVGKLQINDQYVWTWNHLVTSNGVQLWVPFSNINSSGTHDECPSWSLGGSSQVTNTATGATKTSSSPGANVVTATVGQKITFEHTVTNLGPTATGGPNPYTWKVEGCYTPNDTGPGEDGLCNNPADFGPYKDGGGGTGPPPAGEPGPLPSGGPAGSVAVNGNSPNGGPGSKSTYIFPGNAPANAKYCQIVFWTNGSGPSDNGYHAGDHSGIVCAELKLAVGSQPTCGLEPTGDLNPEVGTTFGITATITFDTVADASAATISSPMSVTVTSTTDGSMTSGSIPGWTKSGDAATGETPSPPTMSLAVAGVANAVGTVTVNTKTVSCTGQISIVAYPYFKVYGADIYAGGGFTADNCTSTGDIGSWYNSNTAEAGASTLFAAIAEGTITGFASGQNDSGGPPNRLTFANSAGITGTTPIQNFGGTFGDQHCLYTTTEPAGDPTNDTPNPASVGSGVLASGIHGYNASSQGLHLEGGTLDSGNVTLYVTGGDVYIDDGVIYGNGWTLTNAPSFILDVTGGDIYIDHSVTNLSGIYVAEPGSGGNGGTIYDCSETNDGTVEPVPSDDLYDTCDNQLTVQGSFVAKQIDLMRTYGTLNNATSAENPRSGASPTCAQVVGALVSTPSVCAAEVFDFSPEMYLSNPNIAEPSSGPPQYDAQSSLPPVL